jgi:hypothetical protein
MKLLSTAVVIPKAGRGRSPFCRVMVAGDSVKRESDGEDGDGDGSDLELSLACWSQDRHR